MGWLFVSVIIGICLLEVRMRQQLYGINREMAWIQTRMDNVSFDNQLLQAALEYLCLRQESLNLTAEQSINDQYYLQLYKCKGILELSYPSPAPSAQMAARRARLDQLLSIVREKQYHSSAMVLINQLEPTLLATR
ncbi:MAG: hypothetical protein U0517_00910 [Candidatus Andersenbacteria bacterium]